MPFLLSFVCGGRRWVASAVDGERILPAAVPGLTTAAEAGVTAMGDTRWDAATAAAMAQEQKNPAHRNNAEGTDQTARMLHQH